MHIIEFPLPEHHTEPRWQEYQRLTTEHHREIIGGPQWDVDAESSLISARADTESAIRRFLAYDGGLAVGFGRTHRNLVDSPHRANVNVYVSPSHRGAGVGNGLASRAREACVEDGVTVAHAYVSTPAVENPMRPSSGFGGVDPQHPGVRMALANGFTLGQAERVSRYDLGSPIMDPAEAMDASAAVAGDDYEVITLDGLLPDELLASYGVLMEGMSTDLPTGDLSVTQRQWSAERVRETEQRILLTNHLYRAVIRHRPSGSLVALSELVIDKGNPNAFVDQWDTIVLAAHRGRKLGMLVKAANLIQVRDKAPTAEAIVTWNAEENAAMLHVNEALGFYPILYEGAFEAKA